MAKRNILILDESGSDWCDFLQEFFEDTPVDLFLVHRSTDFNTHFDRRKPDIVFICATLMNVGIAQKLKVLKQSSPDFRLFELGNKQEGRSEVPFDLHFSHPDLLSDFRKKFVAALPLPETISVLIVDDEPEIGGALRDYLDGRSNPHFEVEYVENGKLGLEAIAKKKRDVLILDIKMPVMTGQEVYREICRKGMDVAVIVFFDAISGNEVMELRKHGSPMIVDKGSDQSSMPEMMALIKTMAYLHTS